MLPEWDFGGDDAKRRAFIEWVWTELDRYAGLVTVTPFMDDLDWAAVFKPGAKIVRSVGRPVRPLEGVNGMVWDYLLIRYMFGRYWPRKRRREDDAASAVNIAVMRNLRLPPGSRKGDRARGALHHEARDALVGELKRGLLSVSVGKGKRRVKSAGRLQAEDDIARLDKLPPHMFADNFAG